MRVARIQGRKPPPRLLCHDTRDQRQRPAPDFMERRFTATAATSCVSPIRLRTDLGRLYLPGFRPRCLEPSRRGLVDRRGPRGLLLLTSNSNVTCPVDRPHPA